MADALLGCERGDSNPHGFLHWILGHAHALGAKSLRLRKHPQTYVGVPVIDADDYGIDCAHRKPNLLTATCL